MRSMTLLGNTDAVFGWDGQRPYLAEDMFAGAPPPPSGLGMAAGVQYLRDGSVRAFRDRLGLGKLFWAQEPSGRVLMAARPIQLVRTGHAFDRISALPRGCMLELDSRGQVRQETQANAPKRAEKFNGLTIPEIGAAIRRELDRYLEAIAAAYPGRRAYVCLSGGLDSSTIAVLVKNHFENVTAISFDLALPSGNESADRIAARKLAVDLGLELIECTVSVDELLGWLDLVLVEGIDWRDFNVHAALVNAALADAVARHCSESDVRPLVITGDLSNEFLVDYKPEAYRGNAYYSLPRIDPDRLRDILIQGLETTHREAGVFHAWDLPLVQPFAVAVEAYLSLPAAFLRQENRKDLLVKEIVGSALPDYIYERPKVRAQVGGTDEGAGVLGACVDRGIDAAYLRRRFAELHSITGNDSLERFIRAGRYRASVPSTMEAAV
jgi:asparagine synthetase B (glutamine-hydrolysing)